MEEVTAFASQFRDESFATVKDVKEPMTLPPNTDRRTFDLFIFWVSECRLPDLPEGIGWDPLKHRERCAIHQSAFAKLWMLAQEYSLPKLQNEAMESLLEISLFGTIKPQMLSAYLGHEDWENTQLQDVLLLEVTYRLLEGAYTLKDQQRFARLDGFFPLFLKLARGEGKLNPNYTSPSIEWGDNRDAGAFLVPETGSDGEAEDEEAGLELSD
ncbi:hypothetical protein KC349_g1883 [Hortaea werneckii]|nr:hypothetical protein KC349_g1883 [Hortaea werneckii]